MNELSLFSGAGGGLLGTHHLLGSRTIGYVEWNEYCQRVLAARIKDGYLSEAPIFTDVREFVQSGAAEQYKGFADVVTAGFPCQPFSVAGKQKAENDERNMWPATSDVIRIVQPASVLLENVPGLISCGYLGAIIADLAAMGYVGRWGVIGAADCGAPHKRDRLWIMAYANHAEWREEREARNRLALGQDGLPQREEGTSGSERGGSHVAHAHCDRLQGSPSREVTGCAEVNDARREALRGSGPWGLDPADDPESRLGRVANGVAHRVDRLKAIGNGQVPAVVARAWQELA